MPHASNGTQATTRRKRSTPPATLGVLDASANGRPAGYRNRIVGHAEIDPTQLLANPKNWRIHPKVQEDALAGVLEEVGWVDSILVNQNTGFVVDGHMRAAHAIGKGEATVPVDYCDLTEAEEDLVLATFDPISAMAKRDDEQRSALLASMKSDNERVQALLTSLKERQHMEMPAPTQALPSRFMVIVECAGETQQTQLLEEFAQRGLECRALLS